jgi:hypothetical protein
MPAYLPPKRSAPGGDWDRDSFFGTMKEVHAWYRAPRKRGILILGAGGVGKTTLANLLSGEFDLLQGGLERYDETTDVERFRLKDADDVEIVVPPGQKHRREATWTDLQADLAAGKYRGVILVSAYGYHALAERSYTDYRRFHGKKDAFLKAFLKNNRQDEVAVLQQLLPHLLANLQKVWFVSLIVKQDLWWPARTTVEKHYRTGDYGAAIRRIHRRKAAGIRHEFVFASLLIANFVSQNDELLKPCAKGYDYPRQAHSLRSLFETVNALRLWESEK